MLRKAVRRLRHDTARTQFPYSVANPLPCRNNSMKILRNYLPNAQNRLTFAS